MKKIILFVTAFTAVILGFSQNPSIVPDNVPGAFIDTIYLPQEVLKTTEKYKSQVPQFSVPVDVNTIFKEDLYMDIYYTPIGSNCFGLKPVIVFAPGAGEDRQVYESIARDLVRRGYIVASISTRKSNPVWAFFAQLDLINNPKKKKKYHPLYIYTAAMDMHLAIKYLINQRASIYGIDPNYVIVGGGSKGAGTALQATFMNKTEANAQFGSTVDTNLNVNVNVNDPFFNDFDVSLQGNNIKGVISFSGAVYNTSFITPAETTPVFMFHGNKDDKVPYKTYYSHYDTTDVLLYGSASIATTIKNNGNSYCLITGKEVGHTTKPACFYIDESFPAGYPMSWYPDMLSFIKNSVFCNKLNQFSKNIECTLAIGCDPASVAASCRSINGAVQAISNTATYSTPVVLANLPTQACQPTTINEHCHAFSFDGGDYIKIPSSSSLNYTDSKIIDFWFKKDGTIPNNKITILYSAGVDLNVNNSRLTIGLIGENQLWIYAKDPVSGNTFSQTNLISPIGLDWRHYIFSTYYNHLKYPDSISTDLTLPFNINTNSCSNFFGGMPYTTGTTPFPIIGSKGQLDNIRYWVDSPDPWSHAIAGIQNTKNDNICPSYGYLTGYWKLNQNSQTVKDETNFHNDGTMGLTTSVETSDPTYVTNCNTSARMANTTGNSTQNDAEFKEKESIVTATEKKEILSVFPNPSSGKPTVLFISPYAGLANFQLLDNKGTAIINKYNVQLNNEMTILSDYLPNLASGIYFIKISTGLKTYEEKFVITK